MPRLPVVVGDNSSSWQLQATDEQCDGQPGTGYGPLDRPVRLTVPVVAVVPPLERKVHEGTDLRSDSADGLAKSFGARFRGNHDTAPIDLHRKTVAVVGLFQDEIPEPHRPESVEACATQLGRLDTDTVALLDKRKERLVASVGAVDRQGLSRLLQDFWHSISPLCLASMSSRLHGAGIYVRKNKDLYTLRAR
jgi:hypothetical protein